MKNAFLSAFEEEVGAAGEGGEGFGSGVLQARKQKKGAAAGGSDAEDEAVGMEAGGEGGESEAAAAARVQQLLDGYFGRDEQLSADDRFLKRYILNKVGACCLVMGRESGSWGGCWWRVGPLSGMPSAVHTNWWAKLMGCAFCCSG